MERGLLIRSPQPGWAASAFERLYPGGHACVFGPYREALAAEEAGFEVRDCIVALGLGVQQRVWLLRKSIEAQNVAAQVLKTGTGGIWIDGCRIGAESADPRGTIRQNQGGGTNTKHWRTGAPGSVGSTSGSLAGRWPPNLVFIHGPECRQQGTRQVPGHKGYPNGPGGKSFQYSSDKRGAEVRPDAWAGHADADGLETVTAWECQQGCPVAALDQQSGVLSSHGLLAGHKRGDGPNVPYGGGGVVVKDYPVDFGGASRFYPQFANDLELDGWLQRLILGPEE